ncbi:hypothetical protein PR003_g23810 [Phytophthora rubi]|uniref:Uncharacterized protein n=1 Tax=Phytophthora rubi TaxID=129364 RepID=A0A6A3IA67_9STRA|nr:hypothetical protein PR001_g25068 [Phytophthora rubi]KAE9296231.1 hypothetical protein PR003_g23810 [Phytophthora rubi]
MTTKASLSFCVWPSPASSSRMRPLPRIISSA